MKGILLKPDMITAIVEGRKVQTRRVGGLEKINNNRNHYQLVHITDKLGYSASEGFKWFGFQADDSLSTIYFKPRYQPGEVVYIKETWNSGYDGQDIPLFKIGLSQADIEQLESDSLWTGWRSPMMMPEKYARYHIKILSVEAQRLQEINRQGHHDDILKEGYPFGLDIESVNESPISTFANLWDSINKPPYDWASNPWVWKYTFEVLKEEQC